MSEFLIDISRLIVGVGSGILAMYFAVVTYRMVATGRDAYNVNRLISPQNPLDAMQGRLKTSVKDGDKRTSHGVALDLKTGRLEEQKRLSTEATDLLKRMKENDQ